jgi:hypothetical protein
MVAIDVSVKFWPGDAAVPSTGVPSGVLHQNPGALDQTALTPVLRAAEEGVRTCYAHGLASDPHLWGRLQLLITLEPDGSLLRVVENESRFPDPRVSQCVTQLLERLHYPAPGGGRLTFVQAYRLGMPPDASEEPAAAASR